MQKELEAGVELWNPMRTPRQGGATDGLMK